MSQIFNPKLLAKKEPKSPLEIQLSYTTKKMHNLDTQIQQLITTHTPVKSTKASKSLIKKFKTLIEKMIQADPADSSNFLATYPARCIPELTEACRLKVLKTDLAPKVIPQMQFIYAVQDESVKKHYKEYFPQLVEQ